LNPAGFTGSVAQPDVVAEVAQPALRLRSQTVQARDKRASQNRRAGDQPEQLKVNFAVGEILLVVKPGRASWSLSIKSEQP
jgi:hypothetical protein